jgi:hypothetical protein
MNLMTTRNVVVKATTTPHASSKFEGLVSHISTCNACTCQAILSKEKLDDPFFFFLINSLILQLLFRVFEIMIIIVV